VHNFGELSASLGKTAVQLYFNIIRNLFNELVCYLFLMQELTANAGAFDQKY